MEGGAGRVGRAIEVLVLRYDPVHSMMITKTGEDKGFCTCTQVGPQVLLHTCGPALYRHPMMAGNMAW